MVLRVNEPAEIPECETDGEPLPMPEDQWRTSCAAGLLLCGAHFEEHLGECETCANEVMGAQDRDDERD